MWWRWGLIGIGISLLCGSAVNGNADSGQIYACVQQGSNSVRIVSAPGQCRGPETPVAWAIQGPTGPIGPQGTTRPERRHWAGWTPRRVCTRRGGRRVPDPVH